MKYLLCFLLFAYFQLSAQEVVTGTYDFQTDPAKKYALYIPANYDATVPTKVIVGLHPWNTSKWDAESWAEELSEVAEANDCIVICPDGGVDGQIDDPIDTAFTTFLIDEVIANYNIDESQIFLTGFSWGGKTVYTYGLNHVERFAGFMPIGAAVELTEVSPFGAIAKDKYFYVIHGSQDSPSVRFTPLVDLLETNEACVETNLLSGVGHTVEFPDQFNILNAGLQWLLNATPCNVVDAVTNFEVPSILLQRNIVAVGEQIVINTDVKVTWALYDSQGDQIAKGLTKTVDVNLSAGVYFVQINKQESIKVIVQ